MSPPITHTRPSATAEATSWRAVGAGARPCQTAGAGVVVVVVGAAVVEGLVPVVEAVCAAEVVGRADGDVVALQAVASANRKAADRAMGIDSTVRAGGQ
ncbi:MAG: hypothetical protein ACR2KK_11645 [Acidimicrobiales bacterium]